MLEGLIEIFEDTPEWEPTDTNKDGMITGDDIPYKPGSIQAKIAWKKIEALAHSPENIQKAKSLGYENARGWYAGGPLVPNSAGPGETDFQLLKDRLTWYNGYEPEVSTKIAAKAKFAKYGG